MELHQINYFRAVVEEKSLSAAAARMGIAQPTLSRSLSALEKDLGTTLFDRTAGNKLSVNRNGEIFYFRTEQALQFLQDAVLSVRENKDPNQGRIRFIAPAYQFINAFLEGFVTRYPHVRIQRMTMPPEPISQMLTQRTIDFALTHTPLNSVRIDWQPLFTQTWSVLVFETHPLAGENEISLAALADSVFVSPQYPTDIESVLAYRFRQAGIFPDFLFYGAGEKLLEGYLTHAQAVLLVPGTGIAQTLMPGLLTHPQMRRIPVSDRGCETAFGVAVLKDHYLNAAANMFLKELRQDLSVSTA